MQYLYHKPRISRSKMVERLEYSNESPGVSTSGMNEIIAWLRWEKKSACLPACGRPGFDPRVGKIPRRREWQSTPIFLPGESYGQRSLADYSPWGLKESDTFERLTLSLSCLGLLRLQSCLGLGPCPQGVCSLVEILKVL